MKEQEKCCGTCKWHLPDGVFPDDWVCANVFSENAGDYSEYSDSCDQWEEREKKCGKS